MAKRSVSLLVAIAALGYFVDIYDLLLFGIVRNPSLTSLGFAGEELKAQGVWLLNSQMAGLLLGGILWGVLGDKRGRLSVLFGSIFLYSAANIANGFVTTINTYAVLRFIAGVGLAGELGAGVTLVSEVMPKETRGYGTTIIASFGVLGAVVAAVVGDYFDWRTAYFVGGGLGLALLILRIGAYESGMFERLRQADVRRGAFFSLFTSRERFFKYLSCIVIGVPLWYVVGLLATFASEFSHALKISGTVVPGRAIMFTYLGLSVGDFLSGYLSQIFKTRKKIIILFIIILAIISGMQLTAFNASSTFFYALYLALGIAAGYWAVFMINASEQFGTNLRSTVTTTAPNFVRGSVILTTTSFQLIGRSQGDLVAAAVVGVVCTVLALIAALSLKETYGKDLEYVELI